MTTIKKELNKWQFIYEYGKRIDIYDGRVFRLGLINIQIFPENGEAFSRKCYKGFLFVHRFRHPLSILKQYLEHKGY